jgi:type IV secretory pathway TraG/TraD family ATPase VirD4
MAALAALNRHIGDPNKRHTWLIIDELKTVGQLPSLPHLLDKGRKYSTSVVLGFQAISQIRKIYGEDDAHSILQGLQNQFFFRMSEVESARYVSETLGDQDVEQASVSSNFGPDGFGQRGSISRTTVRRKLVLSDEVRSLETLTAFGVLSGQKPVKVKFEPKNRKQKAQTAVSRVNTKHLNRFAAMIAEQQVQQAEDEQSRVPENQNSHVGITKTDSNKTLIAFAEGG